MLGALVVKISFANATTFSLIRKGEREGRRFNEKSFLAHLFDQTPHEIIARGTIGRFLVIVIDQDVIARHRESLLIGSPNDDFDETRRRQIARSGDQFQGGRLVIGRNEKQFDVMTIGVAF